MRRTTVAMICGLTLLAGCGGNSSGAQTVPPAASSSEASSSDAAPSAEASAEGSPAAESSAETPAEPSAEASSKPAAGASPSAKAQGPRGTRFTDPGNTYTITVGAGWEELSPPPAKGVEAWAVAAPKNGFTPNVNVLTQDVPGYDVPKYMEASLQSMGQAKVISHKFLKGTAGQQLGLIEYTQTMPAGGKSRKLHFVATFDVDGGRAVVATLTAEEVSFAKLRKQIEPYLQTLKAS